MRGGIPLVLIAALAGPTRAVADEVGRPNQPVLPRSTADLDDTYLWLGPSGAAAQIDGGWHSSWGGGVQVVRVRERQALGVIGGWLSGVHYAGRDGGRIALEAVVGTRRLLGPMIGIGAGPAVELGERRHPRLGLQGSAWLFAGATPYVRLGWLQGSGGFAELGVQLSLPVRRF